MREQRRAIRHVLVPQSVQVGLHQGTSKTLLLVLRQHRKRVDADRSTFFLMAETGVRRVGMGGNVHIVVRDYWVCGFGGNYVAEEDDFAFRVAAVDGIGRGVRGE